MGLLEDAYAPDPNLISDAYGKPANAVGSPFLDAAYSGSPIPAQPGEVGESTRNISFAEHATNFIADQFDPINIAMLAASFGGWSIGGKIAARAGFSGLKAIGATELGSEILAPSMLGRVIHRASSGLGGAIPFALGEAIEDPEPGQTRIGNFGRELLALEVIDLALAIPAGGLFNRAVSRFRGSKYKDELIRQATGTSIVSAEKAALQKGMSATDAKAAAFSSVITAKIKQAETEFGPAAARDILAAADKLASSPPEKLEEMIAQQVEKLRSDPAVVEAITRQGIPQSALDDVLRTLQNDSRAIKGVEQTAAFRAMEDGPSAATREAIQKRERIPLSPRQQMGAAGARQDARTAAGEAKAEEAALEAFRKQKRPQIKGSEGEPRGGPGGVSPEQEEINRFHTLNPSEPTLLPPTMHPLVRQTLDAEAARLGAPKVVEAVTAPEKGVVSLVDSFARDAGIGAAPKVVSKKAAAPTLSPLTELDSSTPTAFIIQTPDLPAPTVTTDAREAALNELNGGRTLSLETGEDLTDAVINAHSKILREEERLASDLAERSVSSDLSTLRRAGATANDLGLSHVTGPDIDAQALGEAAGASGIDELVAGAQRGVPSGSGLTRSPDGQLHPPTPASSPLSALSDPESAAIRADLDAAEKAMRKNPQPKGPCKAGDFD